MKKLFALLLSACLVGCATNDASTNQSTTTTTNTTTPSEQTTILIAAAASLENVFEDELIPAFEAANPTIKVEGNYDSSGKLQKQIEEGLEADIFFSAALKQMNALIEEDLIDDTTKVDLLENQLVLISAKDATTSVTTTSEILNASSIAIGDPESVPAGQYAQKALESLGIFEQVSEVASLGTNVTEVLNWVASGSAEVGLVYSTDAASMENVQVIEVVSSDLIGDKIIYPVAIVKNSSKQEAAKAFMAFLQSDASKEVFKAYGFAAN
ncbi:MAG: molybdate ABC transporter substrate-binding protein [Erysipelotrichaceae bacterium]|nr:molybdate ABC transporter substrate-binding protein [Erysipelotrichaceae bacterium]MDY5251158.1 molybdate ABC transporter substrate-binding protein [Erysipelotrichaceae bacterium]